MSIEIDPAEQPVRGRVRVAGEAGLSEFAGWVELVQVLERIRVAAMADHDHRHGPGEDD